MSIGVAHMTEKAKISTLTLPRKVLPLNQYLKLYEFIDCRLS